MCCGLCVRVVSEASPEGIYIDCPITYRMWQLPRLTCHALKTAGALVTSIIHIQACASHGPLLYAYNTQGPQYIKRKSETGGTCGYDEVIIPVANA